MTVQPLKNLSIISVILLVFVIPIYSNFCYQWIREFTTVRVALGISIFVTSLALSFWFFWLGVKITGKNNIKPATDKKLTKRLTIWATISFILYIGILLVDKIYIFDIFNSFLGFDISRVLAYKLPDILYRLGIFTTLGVFVGAHNSNQWGRKILLYGIVCLLLYLVCLIGAELVYYRPDRFHVYYALIHALSLIPLIGIVMFGYLLAQLDIVGRFIEKHSKLWNFLSFLCPTAIFVWLIGNSIEIILPYLLVMWLIYKWNKKIKISIVERRERL